jgi:hypothetical protein
MEIVRCLFNDPVDYSYCDWVIIMSWNENWKIGVVA